MFEQKTRAFFNDRVLAPFMNVDPDYNLPFINVLYTLVKRTKTFRLRFIFWISELLG